MDEKLTPDSSFNLSGFIAHGKNRFGVNMRDGETPAECELLDGVILAGRKSCLQRSGVRFDPRFDFHFYDLDFCRSARSKGLRLVTWPIALTHQSAGAFGSEHWWAKRAVYLYKWRAGDDAPPYVSEEAYRDNYAEWVRRYDGLTDEARAAMLGRIEGFAHRPLISKYDRIVPDRELSDNTMQTIGISQEIPFPTKLFLRGKIASQLAKVAYSNTRPNSGRCLLRSNPATKSSCWFTVPSKSPKRIKVFLSSFLKSPQRVMRQIKFLRPTP